jgi:hypothetical protein
MKVLFIPRFPSDKDYKFMDMLMNTFTKQGIRIDICSFTKKDIHAGIKNGATFILNLIGRFPASASMFMGDNKPDAVARMLEELKEIEKQVPMYPPVNFFQFTESKKYLELLPNKTNLFMPGTKTFLYYKTTASKHLEDICQYLKRKQILKIVIKLGWSGWSDYVYRYSIDDLDVPEIKQNLLMALGNYRSIIGLPYMVIVQPFNEIISDRQNEYRLHFYNGKMSPITSFGVYTPTPSRDYPICIPSNELNPNNSIHASVIQIANKGYDTLSKYIGFTPLMLRIDISWVMENGKKRFYINEFEGINGSFYFLFPYIPKSPRSKRVLDVYECKQTTCLPYPKEVIQDFVDGIVEYIQIHSK